jgi:c-di-GMP-binding flagellar brake protein YcgR
MENRRESYRLVIVPERPLVADLHVAGGQSLRGVITDLSVGGVSVRLQPQGAGDLSQGTWFISIALIPSQEPLVVAAELMHMQAADSPIAGFRFLRLADYKAHAEIEKRICSYLLNEQREELFRRRAGSHPAQQ